MTEPTTADFERILSRAVEDLTGLALSGVIWKGAAAFEGAVLEALERAAGSAAASLDRSPHPHAFPDIVLGRFGVEVKYTNKDSWMAVGNSIFEGRRDPAVEELYIVYGKLGGYPNVRWSRYEECVTHVRLSHAPRFVVDLQSSGSLFDRLGLSYATFQDLSPEEKMRHVRAYARSRLKPGEKLWWLEDREEQEHGLPLEVRVYMNLSDDEKRRCRAEAALLCPQICKPPHAKNKYTDAALYLLTHHGVFCPQTRDLFTAGSVALRGDERRGGSYLVRALRDIEKEMRMAAKTLDDALFEEYWGEACARDRRIERWLELASGHAKDWSPVAELFVDSVGGDGGAQPSVQVDGQIGWSETEQVEADRFGGGSGEAGAPIS